MAIPHIGQDAFEKTVAQGDVLVDFFADWCGPCQMLAPELEQLAQAHPALQIAKINVDENTALAMQYGVSSIPTLLLFRGGQVAKKLVGYRTQAELAAELGL